MSAHSFSGTLSVKISNHDLARVLFPHKYNMDELHNKRLCLLLSLGISLKVFSFLKTHWSSRYLQRYTLRLIYNTIKVRLIVAIGFIFSSQGDAYASQCKNQIDCLKLYHFP